MLAGDVQAGPRTGQTEQKTAKSLVVCGATCEANVSLGSMTATCFGENRRKRRTPEFFAPPASVAKPLAVFETAGTSFFAACLNIFKFSKSNEVVRNCGIWRLGFRCLYVHDDRNIPRECTARSTASVVELARLEVLSSN